MATTQLSETNQEKLLKRLVPKTQNMKEAQGADFDLFRGFEAWATLRSLTASEAKVQGILGTALLSGNAHILVISLGRLIDKTAGQQSSLKQLWTDYSGAIPDSNEKQLIKKGLHHSDKSGQLKYVHFLRNNIFAHNKETQISIDNEPIEQALHFCIRTWHLLSELTQWNFKRFPSKDFNYEDWKLKSIFNPQEYDLFKCAWNDCNAKGDSWKNTPLIS